MTEHQQKGDPYLQYTKQFFERWVALYDCFAWPIFYVYDHTVKAIAPQPGQSVLDICTGTGEIALRCAKLGADVTGIDITEVMLGRAKAKAHSRLGENASVRFEIMDARELTFADRSFDCVVISLALHDMPKPVRIQVLNEAARVSRGKIVICDYAFSKNSVLKALQVWTLVLFETSYLKRFADDGVEAVLASCNLNGKSVSTKIPLFFALYEINL